MTFERAKLWLSLIRHWYVPLLKVLAFEAMIQHSNPKSCGSINPLVDQR